MEYRDRFSLALLIIMLVLFIQVVGAAAFLLFQIAGYIPSNYYTISNVTLYMKNYTIRFIAECPGCAGYTTGNDDIYILASNTTMQQLYHVCLHEACHNLAPFKMNVFDPSLEEKFCDAYQYDEGCMRMVFWIWEQSKA